MIQLSNKAGFSITEILIAAVLSGFVMIGIARIVTTFDKQHKSVSNDDELNSAFIHLRDIMINKEKCPELLKAYNFISFNSSVSSPSDISTLSDLDFETSNMSSTPVQVSSLSYFNIKLFEVDRYIYVNSTQELNAEGNYEEQHTSTSSWKVDSLKLKDFKFVKFFDFREDGISLDATGVPTEPSDDSAMYYMTFQGVFSTAQKTETKEINLIALFATDADHENGKTIGQIVSCYGAP